MKKAIVIYQSKSGITQKLGNEIGENLINKGIETDVLALQDVAETDLSHYDYIFMGCWTKGLMVFAQHPDKEWQRFAQSVKVSEKSKLALFTTFKMLTGSMFSKMRKSLPNEVHPHVNLEIKSRNGQMSGNDTKLIDNYVCS